MILSKQTINVLLLALALSVPGAYGQTNDLQPTVHALVERFPYGDTKGPQWEADKQSLAGYSPEQLVRALIVEIDLDRGSLIDNSDRDLAVYTLFHALNLPPALLCAELDKDQPPERKASLLFVLRNTYQPEVVQALLRQFGDQRLVPLPEDLQMEIAKPKPFRVRDEAYNALVDNVDVPALTHVKTFVGNGRRDEIIQETLTQLKLTPP